MGINQLIQVGNQIKKYRTKKGISQKEMANIIGIPYSTYSNYENNNREPSLETLQKIADALGCGLVALMGIDEYKKTEEYKTGMRSVDAYDGVLALLKNIYGNVQEKDIQQEYGEAFYYLVGNEPDTFILYEGDIENLQNYIESSLPIVVDKIKDTRSEDEVIKEIIEDLNSPEQIEAVKKFISDNT